MNQPAFPTWNNKADIVEGMTLRDYFAAAALETQMMYAADEVDSDICYVVAKMSYKIADAMLKVRDQ
jgi:hypothetical protein